MLFITEMVTSQTDYITAFLEPERSQYIKMIAFHSYSPHSLKKMLSVSGSHGIFRRKIVRGWVVMMKRPPDPHSKSPCRTLLHLTYKMWVLNLLTDQTRSWRWKLKTQEERFWQQTPSYTSYKSSGFNRLISCATTLSQRAQMAFRATVLRDMGIV